MENKRMRSSNIELLRIVAMAMIVTAHVVHNGPRFQLIDRSSIAAMQNGLFCQPEFYRRLFLVAGFLPFGNIANGLFMIISGFFMVERGKHIKIGDISKKVVLQVAFAVLMRTLIPLVYYGITMPDKSTIISMGSINEFNSVYWFPGYYLFVMTVATLFLNNYLVSIDSKTYRNILLTTFALFSLSWPGGVINNIADGFRTLMCGLFLYAMGGYIKKHNPFGAIKSWALWMVIILSFILIYISYYGNVQNGIHSYVAKGSTGDVFIQPLYYGDNYTLSVVILAIVLFELFRRLRIPNSRVINFIARATLLIYLMHGHGFWILLVQEHNWIADLAQSPLLYCSEVLKWGALTYLAGIIGYILYLGFNALCGMGKYLVIKLECKDLESGEN